MFRKMYDWAKWRWKTRRDRYHDARIDRSQRGKQVIVFDPDYRREYTVEYTPNTDLTHVIGSLARMMCHEYSYVWSPRVIGHCVEAIASEENLSPACRQSLESVVRNLDADHYLHSPKVSAQRGRQYGQQILTEYLEQYPVRSYTAANPHIEIKPKKRTPNLCARCRREIEGDAK